jgi:ADP-dependent NAD(P)H-hydrate dehydratase / NAD(P)H-hydrate epimerase
MTGPIRVDLSQDWPLHSVAATRAMEAAAQALNPQPTLMQRAGHSVARLSLALAPHAQTIWVACGPGNNGGDGLEAAAWLQRWGKAVQVTWLGALPTASADTQLAHAHAVAAGVRFVSEPPAGFDFAIDALLGIGGNRAPQGLVAAHIAALNASAAPILAVDLPSGLDADTGQPTGYDTNATELIAAHAINTPAKATFCLNLLTLKPAVFTAHGKDAAGEIWFDDLGVQPTESPTAILLGHQHATRPARAHHSHKGSYGDVAVLGGAPGMTGAALLAARAALHAGAGRVFVGLLDGGSLNVDPCQPELMFRALEAIDLAHSAVVCGCGGGEAVRSVLARVLSRAKALVLDADALNAIAQDSSLQALLLARSSRGAATVLTPHPLEAARLAGCSTGQIQAHRLRAAEELAQRFACTVVLKGAGSVIASPGQISRINASGNARLASAGTGDVLAGWVGAEMAQTVLAGTGTVLDAVCRAVAAHGLAADHWPPGQALTASALVAGESPERRMQLL